MARTASKKRTTSGPGKKFAAELEQIDSAFNALPPLGSAEYIACIRKADPVTTPPQVLARAFRQLPPNSESANATLRRLIGEDDETGYLRPVRLLAAKRLAKRRDVEVDDLVQETLLRIVKTLRSSRGAGAERVWVSYVTQQFNDAWREVYGRRTTKTGDDLVTRTVDETTGDEQDPFERADPSVTIQWHGRVKDDQLPRLTELLEVIVAEIVDPEIKAVAILLITGEPVRTSALANEMGITRYKAEQLIDGARGKIRGALMSQEELIDLDTEFLDPPN